MTDEAFLFLVAVVVSLMVLGMYISLVKSVGTLKTSMLKSFIYQYNVSNIISSDLLIGRSKFTNTIYSPNLPSGDQWPIMTPSESVFPSTVNVRLILCNGIDGSYGNKYKELLEKIASWFDLKTNIEILNEKPDKYDKYTLYIFLCRSVKVQNTNLYTLELKYNVYKVNVSNTNGVARAFLTFLGCGITTYKYCLNTPIFIDQGKKYLILNHGVIFGYVCPCCITNIEASLASLSQSSTYDGPCNNITREYKRLTRDNIFVPGMWMCFYNTRDGPVFCSDASCIKIDSIYSIVNEKIKVPVTITDRINDTCSNYFDECKLVGCFYKAVWYVKSGNTFEQW